MTTRKRFLTILIPSIIFMVIVTTLILNERSEIQVERVNLNEAMERNIEARESLINTLENHADFLFVQNAFNMKYYDRVSDNCFANEEGETFCRSLFTGESEEWYEK